MRLAALTWSVLLALTAREASARPVVLVELFTAQGCGPCREANGQLGKLAEIPGVAALTFSVDYWDYLGWTDTFARPEFGERQKAYVARQNLREPYTPQMIVDGKPAPKGLKAPEAEKLTRAAIGAPHAQPDIQFIGPRRVDVGFGRAARGGGEVWLVRYAPGQAETQVKAGDNRGQTIVQTNVVREVRKLGAWYGRPRAYRLPAAEGESLRELIVVQAPRGGRVMGLAERAAK